MKRLLFLLIISFPMLLHGQQVVLSAGGEGTGSGGTSSYSVGQVAYTYNNSGASLSEGVQQAFEATNLPVELLYFDAEELEGSKVKLSWETAMELNNDYFTVERSQNGTDWEEVAKVLGSGTSTLRQSYSYLDLLPYKGLSYYRLKQTDYDGSYSYSKIQSVNINRHEMISFYPNPFKNKVFIETDDYPLEYQLSDINGRLLKSGLILDNQAVLYLSNLLPGVYSLALKLKGQSLSIQKLVKL